MIKFDSRVYAVYFEMFAASFRQQEKGSCWKTSEKKLKIDCQMSEISNSEQLHLCTHSHYSVFFNFITYVGYTFSIYFQ